MTLKELSVLHDLTQEIAMDEERLKLLEEENGTKAQKARVRKIIQEKRNRIWRERERLEEWIAAIPDSMKRKVFTLRFVQGLTWVQVAMAVGGGNTEDGVRKMAKRYVQSQA